MTNAPSGGIPLYRWRAGPKWGVALGITGYLFLTLLVCREMWSGGTVIAGGPPDNEQKVWEIGWWAFALTHGMNPFFTTYLSLPGHPINLMWNNTTPILAVLAIPLTLLVGAVTSFNTLVVLAIWLDATVTFLCLRSLTSNKWTAWFGGLLFGFSPFVFAELNSGRLPWLSLFLLPVSLVLMVRLFVTRPQRRWLLGLEIGAVASAQLFLSEELLLTTALMTVIMIAVWGLVYRDLVSATIRYIGPVLAIAAGVGILVCGYPLWMQFFGPGHDIHGAVIDLHKYVSDLFGFIIPTSSYQLVNVGSSFPRVTALESYNGDAASYLSLPLLCILGYVAVRQWQDPVVRWAIALTGIAMVLSLGGTLHVFGFTTVVPMPWRLFQHLPLIRLAAPRRLMIFAYLGAAVVVARAGQMRWAFSPRRWPVVLGTLSVIALAPASAAFFVPISNPAFFQSRAIGKVPRGSLVVLAPSPAGQARPWAEAMIWQAESDFRFRMIWGSIIQEGIDNHASGAAPPSVLSDYVVGYEDGTAAALTQSAVDAMRSELHHWGTRFVIVGPTPHETAIVGLFDKLLEAPPTTAGGVKLWKVTQPDA